MNPALGYGQERTATAPGRRARTGHQSRKERGFWVVIECMCVVCHGPIPYRTRTRGVTAATCHENCRRMWRRMMDGYELPERYDLIRHRHEYRRELEKVLRHIGAIAHVIERVGLLDERSPAEKQRAYVKATRCKEQPQARMVRRPNSIRH